MSKLTTLPAQLHILGWEEVAPIFAAAWVSDVPAVFIGDPGAAKSTFQARFARALDLNVEILDTQFLTQTRLLGIPNPDKLKMAVLEYVGGVIAKRPDVVIFEEITRCFDHVQGLILEFLREGRLDQVYIKCKRIASCNPPTNDLVGVHHLDYAKATRLVHIQIPNLPKSMYKDFIGTWDVSRSVSPETKAICKQIHELQLVKPPKEKFESIAMSMLNFLGEYKVSGRQVDTLLRLLAASYAIEQAGLHDYTAKEIGMLGASIVPLQLTKNTWNTKPEILATQLVKNLADYPWKQEVKKETKTASIKVEEAQFKFQGMTIENLLGHIKDNSLDCSIAFEILMQKVAESDEWKVPFDGFSKLTI